MTTVQYKRPAGPGKFIEALPPDEKQILAELKRFIEWFEGSAEFRDHCRASSISSFWIDKLNSLGVRNDVIFPMSELKGSQEIHFIEKRILDPEDDLGEIYDNIDELETNPILRLYFKFTLLKHRSSTMHFDWSLNRFDGDSTYFKWRKRRIRAVRSELGWYGHGIDHPTFSIELGIGCTVGCTFCAFDAQTHQTNFDYSVAENRELFKSVAHALKRIIGDGSGGGMLYYATEPNDNPNYIDFLQDWYDITEYKLCTSTARYDLKWIEDLTKFYSTPEPTPWPRISVLSPHCMEKIHNHFKPIDFIYPWILAQSIEMEDERMKVPGGREKYGMKRLETLKDARNSLTAESVDYSIIPQGSIACVTGFKINMVNKTITATSPCYTSYKWSHGYRDYGTVSFSTPESVYPAFIKLIESVMTEEFDPSSIFAWRDDLDFRVLDDGFVLVSPYLFHTFRGTAYYTALGNILSSCNGCSFGEIRDLILKQVEKSDYYTTTVFLQRFYNSGFTDEVVSASIQQSILQAVS